MIIFDFDKTLINKDSLFGFYKAVHGNNTNFKIKRVLLLIGAILYKLKIISNDGLKRLGIFLFLNDQNQKDIEKSSQLYVQTLVLNSLYYDIFLNYPKEKRIIISASPEIYLKKMFPDEKVLGTVLDFKTSKVRLKLNCYKHNKLLRYKQNYPNIPVEAVYSDSYSDKPLFEISNEYHIVKDGNISKTFKK